MRGFTNRIFGLLSLAIAMNFSLNAQECNENLPGNENVVCGCTDQTAFNYNPEATTDDGSCNSLDLPKGWSMFGYTCLDSRDVVVAFEAHKDNIVVFKDESGLAYFPEFNFNGIGNLKYSEGYKIKLKEKLEGFMFCPPIGQSDLDAAYAEGAASVTPEDGISQSDVDAAYAEGVASVTPEDGISQADVDAAYAEGVASVTPEDGISQADLDSVIASYANWCESDTDNDGVCDVLGCMDEFACNYAPEAEYWDSSCEYTSCRDQCGVINGDNSSCSDCAGVPNGTAEDLGCGCGNPAAQEGYDCDGNSNQVDLKIGDIHEGGMVFQINEDGTGLVADLQDWGGNQPWAEVMSAADASTSGGYNDWYLPNIDELTLIYNTIAHGGPNGNVLGIYGFWYWSSTPTSNNRVEYLLMSNGTTGPSYKTQTLKARFVRAF